MKRNLWISLSAGAAVVLFIAASFVGVGFYQEKLNHDRAQARVDAKSLDKVTVGYDTESSGLYPNIPFEIVSYQYNAHFYESLTKFDGDFHIMPQLAESWENPNDNTWRFRLRKDVHFHDGTVMTAADVKASIDMALDNENTADLVPGVKDVKVVDANTVDIETSEASPLLANYLTFVYILPAKEIAAQSYDHPVGTGPYKYVKSENGSVTLSRFEDYYGAKPLVKNVVLKSYTDTAARLAALQRGDVDVIQTVDDSKNVGTDKNGNKLIGASITGIGASEVLLDTTSDKSPLVTGTDSNPFKDLRVRQAMQDALDLNKLISDAGLKDTVPASQVVSPAVFGYDSSISVHKQDITAAKALMKEAGYENGFTVVLDINKNKANVGNAIKAQLAEIGITVNLGLDEPDKDFMTRLQNGEMSMVYVEYIAGTGDALEAYSELYGGDTSLFKNSYSSDEMKALMTKITSTFELSKRKEYLLQLAKLADDSKGDIPFFVAKPSFAYRKGIDLKLRYDGFMTAMDISGAIPDEIKADYTYLGVWKHLFGFKV